MNISLETSKGTYYTNITIGKYGHYGKSYLKAMGEIIYVGGDVTEIVKKFSRGERKLPNRFYRKAESILHKKMVMEGIPHRLKNRGGVSTLATIPTNKVPVYRAMGAWVKVLSETETRTICKIGLYNYKLRF